MFNLLNNKTGWIIMSVVWGFGLACLFRRVCIGRNCVIYKAPPLDSVRNQIFLFDSKCYKYDPQPQRCTREAI